MWKNSKCLVFLSCLDFAVKNSFFSEIILKPKQVLCLEKIFLHGKSLIFYLTPALLFGKKYGVQHVDPDVKITSVVIVVSPLNALITNQINRLKLHGIEAAVLDIKSSVTVAHSGDSGASSEDLSKGEDENKDTDAVCDLLFSDREKLEKGQYNIVFAHPEILVSSKYGRKLMQSKPYQENVCAIVIDEAHYILEWGKDFRVDYGKLAVVSAIFSSLPVIAMTDTANKNDREAIKSSLGLKKCVEIVGNPDRRNITYYKQERLGKDIDSLIEILTPMAKNLLEEKINFPLTIVYMPLKWCGFAYKLFESTLGYNQYYPEGSMAIPQNRLFGQFHSRKQKL